MKRIKLLFFWLSAIVAPFCWALSIFLFKQGDKIVSAIFFTGGVMIVLVGTSYLSENEKHFPTRRKKYFLALIFGIIAFFASQSFIIPSLGL